MISSKVVQGEVLEFAIMMNESACVCANTVRPMLSKKNSNIHLLHKVLKVANS